LGGHALAVAASHACARLSGAALSQSGGPLCHPTQPVAKAAVMQFSVFICKLCMKITASEEYDPNFQSSYSSSKSDKQRAAALS